VGTSCTRNQQQIEVTGLEHYGRPTCIIPRASSQGAATVVGVVNKLDCRRVLLTTRSTCRAKFPEFGQSSRGITFILEIPEFLMTPCRVGGMKRLKPSPYEMTKTSPFRPVVSVCPIGLIYQRVTERRKNDDSIVAYRASIASRGKIDHDRLLIHGKLNKACSLPMVRRYMPSVFTGWHSSRLLWSLNTHTAIVGLSNHGGQGRRGRATR